MATRTAQGVMPCAADREALVTVASLSAAQGMSDLRSKIIRLAHQRPELRAQLLPLVTKTAMALSVPATVSVVAKEFMADHGLKGTPEVTYTPTALTFTFPNWTGTARDLERTVMEAKWYSFERRLTEALDMENYQIDGLPKFSVRGTDAVVTFPMRPYDPDEDSSL